jgi:hypothetical protein
VLISGFTINDQQRLIRLEAVAQSNLGGGAGMMGHAPFLAVHFEGATEEEMHQEDRRNHGALVFS